MVKAQQGVSERPAKPLVLGTRGFLRSDAGKSARPAFIRVREAETIKGNKMTPYADYIYDDYERSKRVLTKKSERSSHPSTPT